MADIRLVDRDSPVDLIDWIFCLKSADEVRLVRNSLKPRITDILFVIEGGTSTECSFEVVGNPFRLNVDDPRDVPIGPASASVARAARGEIDGFRFGTRDGPVWKVDGLRPISADDFLAIISNDDFDAAYRDFVALFDSRDVLRGGRDRDRFEPGGGNDRVLAGGGDDIVHKWRPGNLTYDGGGGHDVLDFGAFGASVAFPSRAVETLTIDLAKGTGRSPWGGRLDLTSVEEIRDTDARDVILGSRRGETVQSDYGGDDVVRLRGGNDTLQVFGSLAGKTYDGGDGRDTLIVSLPSGDSLLDLGDPAAGTGAFAGARLTGVEVISASSVWTGSSFTVIGTGGAETVVFAAGTFAGTPFARADLRLGGGNDRATGGQGNDVIDGGGGRDVIAGGAGDDALTGGGSGDRFVYAAGFGADRIADFGRGDRLDFRGHDGVDRLRDLTIRQVGDDVRLSDGGGGSITLLDVDRGAIGAGDLLF